MPRPEPVRLVLLSIVAGAHLLAACSPDSGETGAGSDTVSVSGGTIAAVLSDDGLVRTYRGIPFAAPPLGELRWRAPQPVIAWDGIRQADTWGTRCMQGVMFGSPLVTRDEQMGEDCLYLNVWAPASANGKALPVLVVFHGGGFAAGSASEPRTGGEWFARQDIVVVAANYRLGLFGFMAHPELTAEADGHGSGNYGMLDQVAALEWVRDNIAAFGGNPGDVTINGESAGSMSVSAHMASPLSRDLFHKAIGQSGAYFPSPDGGMTADPLAKKEQAGLRFAESVGAASLAALRAKPADELLQAVMGQNGGWGYGPGLDSHFLPEPVDAVFAAGEQADLPLLAGWTSAELGMAVAFNPNAPTPATFAAQLEDRFGDRIDEALAAYPAADDAAASQSAAALASDLFITYSTWKWLEVHADTAAAPVYRYRFDRTLPNDPASRFGAIHAVDIEYAFNALASKPSDWQDADREVANVMSGAFANFVKTGNPNGPGVPDWPEYRASAEVLYLDAVSMAGPEQHRARYEFLDSVTAVPSR